MSGALETAAGAFAVVGVADVVVRTGRELYRFLGDISDAPNGIKRLGECIRDTVLLVDALGNCKQGDVGADIVASFQAAVKALNRELQRLKLLVAKFKGGKTTWTRVKYALDEKKVGKAVGALERAKALLENVLMLVYRESAAREIRKISALVTQIESKTDAGVQALISSLDAHKQSIDSRLDLHEQESSDRQDAHYRALQRNQAKNSSRQDRLLRVSTQTEKRVVLLSGQVRRAAQSSAENHQETRDLLIEKLEGLHIALDQGLPCAKKSGNEVYFVGERPDMVMAYLLSIKDVFDAMVDHVLTHFHDGVPVQDVLALRDEFRQLLSSAAQEEAARYSSSTATSFDTWHFPNNTFGPAEESKHGGTQQPAQNAPPESEGKTPHKSKKRARSKLQSVWFRTPTAKLQLLIPRKGSGSYTRDISGFGMSFASCSQSFAVIDIRFSQSLPHQTRPRISTHLNIFTPASDSQREAYLKVFQKEPSVEEIDRAIRGGSISPYHIDHEGHSLLLLEAAAEYGRADVLQYLESEGIGISGLRQDNSIYRGLISAHDVPMRAFVESVLGYVRPKLYDSAAILADLTLESIFLNYGRSPFHFESVVILDGYLANLQEEGYDCAKYRLKDVESLEDFRWDRKTLWELVSLLVDAGANIRTTVDGTGHIPRLNTVCFSMSNLSSLELWAFDDLLYAFVKAGADIHALDEEQWTPSMSARYIGFWEEWCEALRDSGKAIEDVLKVEGNEWLLADDWENVWFEKTGYGNVESDG